MGWFVVGLTAGCAYFLACESTAAPHWWTWPCDKLMELMNKRWGR